MPDAGIKLECADRITRRAAAGGGGTTGGGGSRDHRRHRRRRLPRHGRSKLSTGQRCGCASDCSSGFCADGYCCNESCSSGCSTCARSGSEGVCGGRAKGDPPRHTSDCKVSSANPCGLDGACDGAGSCRSALMGTACGSGTCQGAAVVGASSCDGLGKCRWEPPSFAPVFLRRQQGCLLRRVHLQQPVRRACLRPDGELRTSACQAPRARPTPTAAPGSAPTTSAATPPARGSASRASSPRASGPVRRSTWARPIPPGLPGQWDPAAAARTGCATAWAVAAYPRATVCLNPSCSGNTLNMAATCDGIGGCRMPGLQDCTPFVCGAKAGACTTVCSSDGECAPGIGCVNHSCGPKQNGQPCAQASECKSGQCVDKVCCESACTGGCRSCALVGSLGKCTMVSAGNAIPRATCSDKGATACGSNGKCDGAGSCQLYAKGTTCAGEGCGSNVYTGPSSCDGAGRCVDPRRPALQPLRLQRQQVLQRLHDRRAVPDAEPLRQQLVRPVQQRRDLHGRQSVQERLLRPRRLLRQEPAPAPASPARSPARSGPAPTSRPAPPIRRASARTRGRPPAEPTGKRQAGACQKYGSAGSVKASVPWVLTSPATSTSSLIAIGTPSSGRSSPAFSRASACCGFEQGSFAEDLAKGVQLGIEGAAMRSRLSRTSSVGETSPARTISACRAAPAKATPSSARTAPLVPAIRADRIDGEIRRRGEILGRGAFPKRWLGKAPWTDQTRRFRASRHVNTGSSPQRSCGRRASAMRRSRSECRQGACIGFIAASTPSVTRPRVSTRGGWPRRSPAVPPRSSAIAPRPRCGSCCGRSGVRSKYPSARRTAAGRDTESASTAAWH